MSKGMAHSNARKRAERQTTHYIAEGETRCTCRGCTAWYYARTVNPNRVIELGTVSVERDEES